MFYLQDPLFKKIENIDKFRNYLDTIDIENLNFDVFNWMNLHTFEMQLVEPQCSTVWKQKFVDLRVSIEASEQDRLKGMKHANDENEVLKIMEIDAIKNLAH